MKALKALNDIVGIVDKATRMVARRNDESRKDTRLAIQMKNSQMAEERLGIQYKRLELAQTKAKKSSKKKSKAK